MRAQNSVSVERFVTRGLRQKNTTLWKHTLCHLTLEINVKVKHSTKKTLADKKTRVLYITDRLTIIISIDHAGCHQYASINQTANINPDGLNAV